MTPRQAPALLLSGVSISYGSGRRRFKAVEDVSFELRSGETLGIIGESGSGKSSLAHAIAGLVPIESGRMEVRGDRPQIVLQDPRSSLNPRRRAWDIITEGLYIREKLGRRERKARAAGLSEMVGLNPGLLGNQPNAFSGGQRQRVAIARALAMEPSLLVLDEPTSALDISVQAQILNLLLELQDRKGLTYVFVSHDIGVIQHVSDMVGVMYRGRIVEFGPVGQVLVSPQHPYTRQLISSVPSIDRVNLRTDPVSLERNAMEVIGVHPV